MIKRDGSKAVSRSFVADESGAAAWRGVRRGGHLANLTLGLTVALLVQVDLRANTNTSIDKIPPLRPPRAELPPTFWETRKGWVIAGGAALVVLLGMATWLTLRTRPRPAPAPGLQARAALEGLRGQNDNGRVLSQVSQIVRRYVRAAFELPEVESTTAEFCEQIKGSPAVGPDFSKSLSGFLRRCDRIKFAPPPVAEQFDAVSEAFQLVTEGEARRAEFLRAREAQAHQGEHPTKTDPGPDGKRDIVLV